MRKIRKQVTKRKNRTNQKMGTVFLKIFLVFLVLFQGALAKQAALPQFDLDEVRTKFERYNFLVGMDETVRPLLESLAHLYRNESDLVVGMFHDQLSFFRTEFPWERESIVVAKDTEKTAPLAFFARNPIDRKCLLPTEFRSAAKAIPIRSRSIDKLVEFLDERCFYFVALDDKLDDAGTVRQEILDNLYHVRPFAKNLNRKDEEGISVVTSTMRNKEEPFYKPLHEDANERTQSAIPMRKCERISQPPRNARDFVRNYLFRSKPVIIENAIHHWDAINKWSNEFLREQYGKQKVHIKLTPRGEFEGCDSAKLFDNYETFSIPEAVRKQLLYPDLVVVRPAVGDMTFNEFLDLIESTGDQEKEVTKDLNDQESVNIANDDGDGIFTNDLKEQTKDSKKFKQSNMATNRSLKSRTNRNNVSAYLEYSSIREYFPELEYDVDEMPFVSNVLRLSHLNMWLSDGHTLGKLHFDPFDNFLCQLRGSKRLTLFEPHRNYDLYESHIQEAMLRFDRVSNSFRNHQLLDSTSMVMSPVDLARPDVERFSNFSRAIPLDCQLNEGDVLYMPAFWWHEVQSFPNTLEKRNLAVNFWYEPFLTKEFPCPECKLDVNKKYRHLLTKYSSTAKAEVRRKTKKMKKKKMESDS